MFRVKKITPVDTVEHSLIVENSVLTPINSVRLLVAINRNMDIAVRQSKQR
jgi:hypothetical protein